MSKLFDPVADVKHLFTWLYDVWVLVAVAVVLVTVFTCAVVSPAMPDDVDCYIHRNGHRYHVFKFRGYGVAVVHDPDCPCHQIKGDQ